MASELEKKGKIRSGGHSVSPHTHFSSVHSDNDWDITLDEVLEGNEQAIRNLESTCARSTDAVLDGEFHICDESGNVIASFRNGHLITKYFDSSNIQHDVAIANESAADFSICDSAGNVILRIANGHIRTKYFDSSNISSNSTSSTPSNPQQTIVQEKKKLVRLLVYGNSWSQQAFSYVPKIIETITNGDVEVQLGMMYIGGCSIEKHNQRFKDNQAEYELHLWKTATRRWITTTYQNWTAPLGYDWDLVVFQQRGEDAKTPSSYAPLRNMMRKLSLKKKNLKFGLSVPITWPKGYTVDGQYIDDSAYQSWLTGTLNTCKTISETYPIDFVLPWGTAIANARTTELDSLGDFGHLSYEGLHVQKGIAYLIEAYTIAMKVLEIYGCGNYGVIGCNYDPSNSQEADTIWPGWYGGMVGLTYPTNATNSDEASRYKLIGQYCAQMALRSPFAVTNCGSMYDFDNYL